MITHLFGGYGDMTKLEEELEAEAVKAAFVDRTIVDVRVIHGMGAMMMLCFMFDDGNVVEVNANCGQNIGYLEVKELRCQV